MGYLCNAESAIATCDSCNYHWPNSKTNTTTTKNKIKYHHKHKHKDMHKQNSRVQDGNNDSDSFQLRRFSFSDLETATGGFSPDTLLGKGSHGSVYRAVLDGGQLLVAVKKTTEKNENEIEILSRIRSPRIVNLIGHAVDPTNSRKLLLVIEHMPGGSLDDLIHKNSRPPGWATRVRIALQVAEAVRALHGSDLPIIHRDIKSSNVLIDGSGDARVSDFGLAVSVPAEDLRVMSTPPAGTLGYLDPCYLAPGDLSPKSDVFSFGILLLEIISGRRAIDVNYSPPAVVEWALPSLKSGSFAEIFDRRIGSPADSTVCIELGALAARCVRSTADKRPSMVEVVDWLGTVYKRVKAPIWSNIRRRVRPVQESSPLVWFDSLNQGEDGEEAGGGGRDLRAWD
ncbi:hypothetical protein Dimus_025011 [Dionaea muscipula]